MKINEVTQLNGQALYESIDRTNDTGFATSELVRVVEAHRDDQWSEAIEGNNFLKMLREGKLPWQK